MEPVDARPDGTEPSALDGTVVESNDVEPSNGSVRYTLRRDHGRSSKDTADAERPLHVNDDAFDMRTVSR